MIRFEATNRVGVATIDRPERRNALNGELCTVFTEALQEQEEARAVIVTGAGSAFSAGADLVTRFGAGDGEGGATDTFRPRFEVLLDAKPVFGPATRALPKLPLTVETGDDGKTYFVAAGPYAEPIGPAFWERK